MRQFREERFIEHQGWLTKQDRYDSKSQLSAQKVLTILGNKTKSGHHWEKRKSKAESTLGPVCTVHNHCFLQWNAKLSEQRKQEINLTLHWLNWVGKWHVHIGLEMHTTTCDSINFYWSNRLLKYLNSQRQSETPASMQSRVWLIPWLSMCPWEQRIVFVWQSSESKETF